jgi:hypothetical protein
MLTQLNQFNDLYAYCIPAIAFQMEGKYQVGETASKASDLGL